MEYLAGEVENFAWWSMHQLCKADKFGCVRSAEIDEETTIAKLEVWYNG